MNAEARTKELPLIFHAPDSLHLAQLNIPWWTENARPAPRQAESRSGIIAGEKVEAFGRERGKSAASAATGNRQ